MVSEPQSTPKNIYIKLIKLVLCVDYHPLQEEGFVIKIEWSTDVQVKHFVIKTLKRQVTLGEVCFLDRQGQVNIGAHRYWDLIHTTPKAQGLLGG